MKHKKLAVLLTLVMAVSVLTVSAFAAPSPETNLPDITVAGDTVVSAATYAGLSDAAKEAVPSGYTLSNAFTLAADTDGEVAITIDTGIAGAVLAQYDGTAWTTIATAGDDGIITANVTLNSDVVFGILAPVSATSGSAAATSTGTTGTTTGTTNVKSPTTGETVSTVAITIAVVFVGMAGVFAVVAKRKAI